MSKFLLYCGIYLIGVFISSIAQILLKKSASRQNVQNIFTHFNKIAPRLSEKIRRRNGRILRTVRSHKGIISEYLNLPTIFAYSIFIGATFLTIYAYKVVPLSVAPILGATEYIFVAMLSRIILKEKINAKRFCGLCTIVIGIIVFSI